MDHNFDRPIAWCTTGFSTEPTSQADAAIENVPPSVKKRNYIESGWTGFWNLALQFQAVHRERVLQIRQGYEKYAIFSQ